MLGRALSADRYADLDSTAPRLYFKSAFLWLSVAKHTAGI